MHSTHLLLEEPIRMASILEPSKSVSIYLVCVRARAWRFWILVFVVDLCLICVFAWTIWLQNFFPAMAKIVGTLGPRSRSVEVISSCLKAGLSGNLIELLIYLILLRFLFIIFQLRNYSPCISLSCAIWFFMGWWGVSSGNSGQFEDCN